VGDRITDERLREIVADEDDYVEAQSMAAELLATRAEVERLLRLMPPTARGITNGPGEGSWSVFAEKVVEERDAARAEVERLRSRVGWLNHLDTAEGRAMHATEAVRVESEQLRADFREAMELLRGVGAPTGYVFLTEAAEWSTKWDSRYCALLERHKNH